MKWNELMRSVSFSSNKAQGYFRYYRNDGSFDEIVAADGNLYKGQVLLPIEGLESFQKDRVVDSVQYKDKLYIATGTKLVEYDGTSAKVVEPYIPQPQEALYIGTNGLADDPEAYITDGTSAFLEIKGVKMGKRYGVVNVPTPITVFITKPEGNAEFKYEYRVRTSDGTGDWLVLKDWSLDNSADFTPSQSVDYEIRVSGRMEGTTETESEYYVPRYTVNTSDMNEDLPYQDIHTCTRVVLHWERLILYGGETEKDLVYISHLKNPGYFPSSHTLRFENEKQEGIKRIVRFRNVLIIFTDTSIQALYGTSPADYRRVMMNTAIGCISPETACVMGNYITFLSSEGIHVLKSLGNVEDRMNVDKIDSMIDNLVPKDDPDACAEVMDEQYHIVFPSHGLRLRYYYDRRIWAKDVSPKMNFRKLYSYDNELFGISDTSKVMRFDPSVYDDDGYVYTDVIETKDFDFGEQYNPKKLKEIQILLGHPSDSSLYVYADGGNIVNPDKEYAEVMEDGAVVWHSEQSNNVDLSPGTVLGKWEMGKSSFGDNPVRLKKLKVSGKCIRVRYKYVHAKSEPHTLIGFGTVFKSKKP
jgi:hypothetical protein